MLTRNRINRRAALRRAAVFGGGVAAFFFPGVGAVSRAAVTGVATAPTAATLPPLDPNFTSGRVIAIRDRGVVLLGPHGQRVVLVTPTTVVWKEFPQSLSAIAIGDDVDARGAATAGGVLLAQWIWANITRFDGRLESVDRTGIRVRIARSNQVAPISLSPVLELINSDGTPFAGALHALVGHDVSGVGVRLLAGHVRATRIWPWK